MSIESTISDYNVASRGILINVSVSQWTGRKFDRAASTAVEQDNASEHGRARVNKLLISAAALQPVSQAATAIRTYVYQNSLPWSDGGDRIMVAGHFIEFSKEFNRLKDEFNQAVDDLVAAYDSEVEAAKFALNALYKDSDYPTADEIRRKFEVRIAVTPVADVGDFRASLPDEAMDLIREQISETMQERQHTAMQELWSALGESLVSIRDRLADDAPRFKSALLENFVGMVDRLGALNIGGDPRVIEMQDQLKKTLCGYDTKDLRKDALARKAYVADADAIIDQFSGMWG